jgi:spore coat protein CotH
MKNKHLLLILFLTNIIPIFSFSQVTTYLFSNLNTGVLDSIRYLPGKSEPDAAWFKREFNDTSWKKEIAILGYGYGPTGYIQIDSTAKSLYTRLSFSVPDKTKIKYLNFFCDYDDGYIAYLNGVEIARVNVDKSIPFPPFDAVATRSHASEIMEELTSPVLGIYLDSTLLANNLVNGKNSIAVHIINDSIGNDLFFFPSIMDISDKRIKNSDQYYSRFDSRYKRLIDIDSSDLPIVVVETDQNGIAYDQRIWANAHMGIINNNEGKYNKPSDPYTDYNGLIRIRQRGQSSRDFPKMSYRFELVDQNLADTSFTLLGMPKESDWILFGPYADKSQVRNKFSYDLASRMGNYSPRTRFCELVLNGQSQGLYLLTEQVKRDKNRINISKLKITDNSGHDVTGGYIFMYDKSDVFSKKDVRINMRKIVYPDTLTSEQQYYLKRYFTVYDSILSKTNNFRDPVKGFRKYANDSSLVDFIIINELTKNPDAYACSVYLYKNRDDKDGRTYFGPLWDCDIAFGTSQFQNGFSTSGWQFDYNSNGTGMKITRYLQDTELVKLLQSRWHELRAKTFSNDSIFTFLDQLLDQAKLARQRNYDVWPVIEKNLFYVYPTAMVSSYDQEISNMKTWITARLNWIDNNINLIHYDLQIVGNNTFESMAGVNLHIYPNPFEKELTLDFNLENEGDTRLEIYNLTGQLHYKKYFGKIDGYQKFTIEDASIGAMPKGMYVAKLYVDNIPVQSVKIIKE